MARAKKPNIWQRLGRRAPYERDAGYVLFGEHDVLRTYAVPGGYESEPTTHPILVKWIDALLAFDDRARHDKAPLISLLDSDIEMIPIVATWLADLVWRHSIDCGVDDYVAQRRQLACILRDFIWPRPTAGRPMRVAYDLSKSDEELYVDDAKVIDHFKEYGGSVADAIKKIVSNKVPRARAGYAHTLTLFHKDKHTGVRRAAKRRR